VSTSDRELELKLADALEELAELDDGPQNSVIVELDTEQDARAFGRLCADVLADRPEIAISWEAVPGSRSMTMWSATEAGPA
jgi:hypothetical protein